MYEALFSKQADWSGLGAEDFLNWLKTEAETLGLNSEKFASDLTSDVIDNKVTSEMDYAHNTIGLNSTPTIY